MLKDKIVKTIRTFSPVNLWLNKVKCEGDIVHIGNCKIKRSEIEKISLFGIGKCASQQISGLLDTMESLGVSSRFKQIVSLTKQNHSITDIRLTQYEGDHPVVSRKSTEATRCFLSHFNEVKRGERVIFFISGGASSVFESQIEGVSLSRLQELNKYLLSSGRGIREINCVRKVLSRIKNGGVLELIVGSPIYAFLSSDVPGNEVEIIGSGPLFYSDQKWEEVFASIPMERFLGVTYEQLGTRIKESEVRKKEFQARSILEWEYFVTPEMVLDQLVAELELDQERVISTGVFDGSIDELMSLQIEKIEKCRKEKGLGSVCLISGGEGTVVVGDVRGCGGRNSHFVLAMAMRLIDHFRGAPCQFEIASIGSDGTDGSNQVAGAYWDLSVERVARRKGLNPRSYLESFDSLSFFQQLGYEVNTGATGLNVMDLRAIKLKFQI